MFLGRRVDDAITLYYRRILEHAERLSLDQVKDAYRDSWHNESEAEPLGIAWEDELDPERAFEVGLDAIELSFRELVPRLGEPVAVQRKLEYVIGAGLEWSVQCYLDLETRRADHAEGVPAVVDYKVKSSPLTEYKAASDFQPSVYLAGRWLEGYPAAEFCFAQIAKPGPRRREMSASLVTTKRSTAQLRGALARIAQVAAQITAATSGSARTGRGGSPTRPDGSAAPATARHGAAVPAAADCRTRPQLPLLRRGPPASPACRGIRTYALYLTGGGVRSSKRGLEVR